MAEDKHPSVYVVDTHASRPPLPPRLGQKNQRMGAAQTLLFLLVSVALCGMAIEACLIYHLYQHESAQSGSSSKQSGDEDVTTPSQQHGSDNSPSKPVAHLTDGHDVVHKPDIMAWSMIAEPLLYEMGYKDGGLIIQKEGYYYVYSKVFFFDCGPFHHSVIRKTVKYVGAGIPLLQSRKYSKKSGTARSNSYLGGVFHLEKDDALYVKVSNTTKIDRHGSYENVFGAYMI
ncbi:tumor necrosis factor ligand superfamily member 14 [Trachinotus anak]|uniref:tumor necrosis factor ligand superfamily member 14 n=1 Tax=Trachinotus anak TaxID=443729 RepID=UPI0039F23E50